jgi:hypothetical protein
MAIFYLDPISGNDASVGTSFATRWKTFTAGATSARITPGDTIRVIASPDATSTAQNATWTDGSLNVTLTTAVTADIDQATTAWAASTNVVTTTSTTRKLGAASSSIAPNATFTTGLAAYKTITSTNFSTYQQVSFWIKIVVGATSADNDLSICLCSDTAGASIVNNIPIPRIFTTSRWCKITVDNAGALGSAIQSVALYVNVDRGAQTVLVNNIIACKASSSVDSITLSSLISKNIGDEPWWSIDSISGTALRLTQKPENDLGTTPASQGYSGTTETVNLYKRDTLVLPSSLQGQTTTDVTNWNLTKAGTLGNPIIFSGGWNRTDMSTRTGETYISQYQAVGACFDPVGRSFCTLDGINWSFFYQGPSSTSSSITNINIIASNINSMENGSLRFTGTPQNCNFSVKNLIQSSVGILLSNGAGISVTGVNYCSNVASAVLIGTANSLFASNVSVSNTILNITNICRNGANTTQINSSGLNFYGSNSNINIVNSIGNVGQNLVFGSATAGGNNLKINITGQLSSPIAPSNTNLMLLGVCNSSINLTGVTVSGATYAIISDLASSNNIVYGGAYAGTTSAIRMYNSGQLILVNSTISSGTISTLPTVQNAELRFQNYGLSTTDQRVYYPGANILTDSTTRHTASGISWKMTITDITTSNSPVASFPLTLPVAKIACNSSALVTASVWVYRSSTSLTTKLVCPGGQILGVASSVSTNASGAINTWEQLTITFTPTQQGVVELQVQCYGAAANVYVDDFSVSQA